MDNVQTVYSSSDLSFKSNTGFDETKSLILDLMEKYGYHKKQLLIIDTPDGVFIRSKDEDWCRLLDDSSAFKEEIKSLTKMEDGEWDAITNKHSSSIHSFGNELLARWQAGS
jgi:hypothetical protein